jgi:hypothetical protein
MWIAENYTPFAVGRAFVRDGDGREVWAVAIRGTFTILADGKLALPDEQVPVSRCPQYRDEPGRSSLVCDSDFSYGKLATDIVVRGQAWAPGKRAIPNMLAGFQLGTIRKKLWVQGDRVWERAPGSKSLSASRAQPFVSMPLEYERAWGGMDPTGNSDWPSNPVGTGYAEDPATLEQIALPNLEDPDEPTTVPGKAPKRVAGFGAIAPNWLQRTRHAGTYDAQWQRERAPLWPADFNPRFFQVAPDDQQSKGFLEGGEVCELSGLTPEGTLRFALPDQRIHTTTLLGDDVEQRKAKLQFVSIEPDLRRLQIVWLMTLECHGREHTLSRTDIRCEGERLCRSRPTRTI